MILRRKAVFQHTSLAASEVAALRATSYYKIGKEELIIRTAWRREFFMRSSSMTTNIHIEASLCERLRSSPRRRSLPERLRWRRSMRPSAVEK